VGEGEPPRETPEKPEQGETRGNHNIQIYPDIAVSFLGVFSPWGRERNPEKPRGRRNHVATGEFDIS
jgi:hypothetical protein